jgi:hypothetical protein
MSAFEQWKERAGRSHKKLNNSPLILWALGAGTLILWACGSISQIRTSELLALGGSIVASGISWGVLSQPWLLLSGQAPIQYVTAWEYGWGVEIITLIVALALTVVWVKLGSLNSFLAKIFVLSSLLLVALNSIADYNATVNGNDLVRFTVALLVAIIVGCGLPVGIGLIEAGCEQY